MAKVSAVVPTYNRADVLSRCLDSIFNQTHSDLEIIVVDDCSTDETYDVVQEYDDPRLRYIKHEENRGGSAARNTGIEAASGKYVAFLDSDDKWLPQKIEKQVRLLEDSDDIDVVYTGVYFSESGNRRLGRIPSVKGDISKEILKKDKVGPTSTVMVRRRCFESVGKFNPELPARQDYDMWIRLSESCKFSYIRQPLVIIHIDRRDRISSHYEQRIHADELIFDRIESRISEFGRLEKSKIVSKQYESRAMYSYLSEEYVDAKTYCIKSIRNYPLGLKRWYLLTLLLLSIDKESEVFTKIRDLFRRAKSSLSHQ